MPLLGLLSAASSVSFGMVLAGVPILVAIAWFLYTIVYNLAISPLSRFPGPKLWAISPIPSQLSILSGRNHLDISALHKRYGPVVRIGPTELAFFSAQAFRDIYGFRPGGRSCIKSRRQYVLPPNGADHLVSAVDNSTHSRQRRLLAQAFSERALREQEGLIRAYVDTLVAKLREAARQGGAERKAAVDIKSWLNYTTFDITGDLMFGEPFDCLKESKLHPWIGMIFGSIQLLVYRFLIAQYPLMDAVLKRCIPKSIVQKGTDHFNLSVRKVDRRLEMGTERPDFMSAILKYGMSEKQGQHEGEKAMSRAEIDSNAFVLILAGSETTATLLSGCVFYLCKSPPAMKHLAEEIRSTFATDKEITFSTTPKLPYLAAVLEESLRMYPPAATTFLRETPLGGETVAGHWVPEKIAVGCHHYASYHSPSNFVLPDNFIPERWLDTEPRFASDQRDVLQPFSLGPRNCIGKNLAYAEMRLVLCKLLFNFDIELYPQSANWADQKAYVVWNKPPLMVTLTERVGERNGAAT